MILEHKTLPEFWKCYNALPEEAQRRADRQFARLIENPLHPWIHLKPIGELWSARVTDACRALAVREGNVFTWFWIGSHDEYEQRLKGEEALLDLRRLYQALSTRNRILVNQRGVTTSNSTSRAAATLAGYLPARQATRVDPIRALRYE